MIHSMFLNRCQITFSLYKLLRPPIHLVPLKVRRLAHRGKEDLEQLNPRISPTHCAWQVDI